MRQFYPYTSVKKPRSAVLFNDMLLLYKDGDALPFAHRAPNRAFGTYTFRKDETLFEFDRFALFKSGNGLLCHYKGFPSLTALLLPIKGAELPSLALADRFRRYLATAYNLDPYTFPRISAISAFEEHISLTADFCGCLTDIVRESNVTERFNLFPINNPSGGFIAVSLPIIALMYRRISALRGFNFRISFADSYPCLGFSAKVLLDGGAVKPEDVPEYSVLSQLAERDSLIVAARLVELGKEEGDMIYRLSVMICPQCVDPRGLLRAPELLKRKESIVDKFDFDIPGRF